jgi:hypothetical protein
MTRNDNASNAKWDACNQAQQHVTGTRLLAVGENIGALALHQHLSFPKLYGFSFMVVVVSFQRHDARGREKRSMAVPNKRKMIQSIIDDEEGPWIIMKPSVQNPSDPDPLCIFDNPGKLTEAKVEIPAEWFQRNELEKIREAIHNALQHARIKLKELNQDL